MSVTYDVLVNYRTSGDPAASLTRLTGSAQSLTSELSKVGGLLSGVGDSILGAVAKTVAWSTAIGAATFGFGIVKKGLIDINSYLEDTQIGLAAIFQAQGLAGNMSQGLEQAGDIMTQMRKDAAALPGEFQDLAGIMQTIFIPATQAGLGGAGAEQLAAKTMAFAEVAGLSSKVAGREMAQLLSGRAGAHNILGMRLMGLSGDSAKAFNELSAADRLTRVTDSLKKYDDAIKEYQHSFKGLSSTFADHLRETAGKALESPFNKVKGLLQTLNEWFDKNQPTVEKWAKSVGVGITEAISKGELFIRRWGPVAYDFVVRFGRELSNEFQKVEPLLEKIGDIVYRFMSDKEGPAHLIAGIKEALKLALELKATGMLLSGIGSGIQLARTIGGAVGAMQGAGAVAGASLGALATVGLVSGGLAVTLVAVEAAAAVGLASAMGTRTENDPVRKQAEDASKYLNDQLDRLDKQFKTMGDDSATLTESLGIAWTKFKGFSLELINSGLTAMGNSGSGADLTGGLNNPSGSQTRLAPTEPVPIDREVQLMPQKSIGLELYEHMNNGTKKPPEPPPTNVHIHNVTIQVNSNQDPSRIARLTKEQLVNLARNPTSSRSAPNPSRITK